jgi:hypothetical protein
LGAPATSTFFLLVTRTAGRKVQIIAIYIDGISAAKGGQAVVVVLEYVR